MRAVQKTGGTIRNIGILLLIVLLVLFFLFLYHFRYVPKNREQLQLQGFSILRQHEKGIQQHIRDLEYFFKARKKEAFHLKSADTVLNYKVPEHPFAYSLHVHASTNKRKNEQAIITMPPYSDTLHAENAMKIKLEDSAKTFEYAVPLNTLIGKILGHDQTNFYQYYMISGWRKNTNGEPEPRIIYRSPDLLASDQMLHDTAGTILSKVEFSGLADLKVNGNRYKAFMSPLQLEGHSLVLTGFMKEKDYTERLQTIPFATVNSLFVIFLLILAGLPLIKVFFLSRDERIGIQDVILQGISLFVGSALLLVILQNTFLQTGARMRTKTELHQLASTIEQTFREELQHVYQELDSFDQELNDAVANKRSNDSTDTPYFKSLFVLGTDTGYCLPFPRSCYLYYDVVQWANDTGKQVYKGRLDIPVFQLNDISYRQYFKDVKNGHFYTLDSNGQISLEPVYSISTNAFEVNIAKRSRVPGIQMAALSARMYSVINPILPEGYGFYIVNDNGVIQFQSEGQVTLKENFIEWINGENDLLNTLQNRQSRFIPVQYINNRQYSIYVRPLARLPLHLIAYQNGEHTTASGLRITAFTLFSLLGLACCLLLVAVFAWSKSMYCSRLNQSVFQYCWLKPGKDKTAFLYSANWFLALYLIFTVVFASLNAAHTAVWFAGFIAPIFALSTLFHLFFHSARIRLWLSGPPSRDRLAAVLQVLSLQLTVVPLLLLLFVYLVAYKLEPSGEWNKLVLLLVLSPLIAVAALIGASAHARHAAKARQKTACNTVKRHYTATPYYLFWLLCILTLALVPAHCFFQFAWQREIRLLTKSQQVHLAKQAALKLRNSDWLNMVQKTRTLDQRQKNEVLLTHGFYGMKNVIGFAPQEQVKTMAGAHPYDTLIRHLSWNYHFRDNALPVQNNAADHVWAWSESPQSDSARLTYQFAYETQNPHLDTALSALRISGPLPHFFQHNQMGGFGRFAVFFSIFLLLLCLFLLIRFIAERVFLIQYFQVRTAQPGVNESHVYLREQVNRSTQRITGQISSLLARYTRLKTVTDNYQGLQDVWENEYRPKDRLGCKGALCRADDKPVDKLEDCILMNQLYLSDFYESIWKSCDARERYFLFDMAEDGFTNYRNGHQIQQALDKGLIVQRDTGDIRLVSISFRNYILSKKQSDEILDLKEQFQINGTWNSIRTPVLITIAAISTFLFITQEGLMQRIAVLLPTLTSLIGLGATVLGSKSSASHAK